MDKMAYLQTILVVLTLALGCEAFFDLFVSSNRNNAREPMCSLPSKPCSLQITQRHLNGTFLDSISTTSCTCPPPNRCSDDWSLESHVISRNLISTNFNMTLKMMFCQPVLPQEYCTINTEALEVSGALSVPYRLDAYNCRCRDNSPLMLHRRWVGEDHMTHQTYVCSEHKATCPYRISQCLVSHFDTVFYHCKCPNGFHCRIEVWEGSSSAFGYCRRRRSRH